MMTIAEKLTELEERAKRSLLNTNAITSELLQDAVRDADQIVGNKDVPAYAYFDIAIYRLKILLKIAPTEWEQSLYDDALKVVKESPIVGSTVKQTAIVCKNRGNEWQ